MGTQNIVYFESELLCLQGTGTFYNFEQSAINVGLLNFCWVPFCQPNHINLQCFAFFIWPWPKLLISLVLI